MSNTYKLVIAIALVLSLIAIGVAITKDTDTSGILNEVRKLGAPVSTETSRSGTGTDFTELGFGQVRTGKFWLVSSSTAPTSTTTNVQSLVTNRLGWTNSTGQDVMVSLENLKYFTTGQASGTQTTAKTAQNNWRVFAATSTSIADDGPIPNAGTIAATTKLLGIPWVIYSGTSATSTSGFALMPVVTAPALNSDLIFASRFSTTTIALDSYPFGTTTYDGINELPEFPMNSVIVKDGETLQFVVRNAYGSECGANENCEAGDSTETGFTLNVVGEYEYRNPLK